MSDEAADRTAGGKLSPFTYFMFLLIKSFLYSDRTFRKLDFMFRLSKAIEEFQVHSYLIFEIFVLTFILNLLKLIQ